MPSDLRTLQKRERQLHNNILLITRFVDNFTEGKDEVQVGVRLQTLEEVSKEFYSIRAKIELLLEDQLPIDEDDAKEDSMQQLEQENYQVMQDFDDQYCGLKSKLLGFQRNLTSTPATDREGSSAETTFSKVKLPEIRLPSFSGKISDWITFRDTFRSLIHQNKKLNEVDKFTYLKSSLVGDALQEIHTIELSAANYDVAWKALQNRFENKKLIVKAYLDALFAVDSLKREGYDGLSRLISDFEKNLQMLEKIGENTAGWSTILAHMVCSRLDAATLRCWETHHSSKDVPTYENLLSFLRNHCSVLQSVMPAKNPVPDQRLLKQSSCHTVLSTQGRCPFCSGSFHSAFLCAKFQGMKVMERNDAVMKNKLCRNCLRPGHQARVCERGACHHCSQKHHSMLHTTSPPVRSSVPLPPSRPSTAPPQSRQPQSMPHNPNQQTHTNTSHALAATDSHSTETPSTSYNATSSNTFVALPVVPTHNVLLSTALVTVRDRVGNSMLARALLDSCSQHCLMTKTFANKLKFREAPAYLSVQGIGSSCAVSTKLVSAKVSARSSIHPTFSEEMQFYVLPKLTAALPTASLDPTQWNLPDATLLADPWFNRSSTIDLIIGAEFYLNLLREGQFQATSEGPTLRNTVFGWIVSGRVPNNFADNPTTTMNLCVTTEIQEQLTKFWELEACRTNSTNSIEESACETIFEQTTTRDTMGGFVVTLPKKEFVIERLGESKTAAMKRFFGLERRLSTNQELRNAYTEFIHEYQLLGHMKEVAEQSANTVYYLPHHAVLKPESTTTKLRVVFDASCRTSTGVSLNDALMVGPVVQDDLINITVRFRLHRYAVVADIAKMYRMIRVQPADCALQRILWRDSPTEDIRTYELTTVTYGTACAPYLATKCLQKLAEKGETTHPTAASILKRDFYMDDLLSGVDRIPDGKALVSEMIDLMESAGFSLRKWCSNCSEIISGVPEHLRDDRFFLPLDSSSSVVKTLGLVWELTSDTFQYNTPKWTSATIITKRTVLSDVSRLFDPLGLVGPVIVQAKIFIQELWKLQCGWDEPLPAELQEQWQVYRRNLRGLEGLAVPRWVGFSKTRSIEFHGFCDASEKAYGACIYVRSVSSSGSVSVHLLISKSRVAPLDNLKRKTKKQSIPRLELSAALLLAHLYEKVIASTHIEAKSYFWTDSMIVKCWLLSTPSRWKEFVANRVSEIQHITRNGIWKHVPGLENPADIISRGMTPAQLHYQSLWFKGPQWLAFDEVHWPQTQNVAEEDIPRFDLEERSMAVVLQTVEASEIFSLRSSLTELIRLTAMICRFRFNAQVSNRTCRRIGALQLDELEEALRMLVKLSQRESFPQEIADLSQRHQVRESSRIVSLNPRLIDGILCVGGRLQHAAVSESRRHPYILDHRHPLAQLVMAYYHRKLFHAGQQLLIAAVRERFWPTQSRNLARKTIHSCVQCFRVKPTVVEQLMADLPPERVNPCSTFQRVGVDYCGPFQIVYPYRRGRPVKCFVAIYVCLVTKAVHLELAADLTTQAFLASLKRFSSRRGKPSLIMCDNATNFVGARRELHELHRLFKSQQFQESVIHTAADDNIEFRFIPARSPNFGGLWESAVKAFKTLFKRTIGTHTLIYDEMQTVLAQVEAILNSRPLTPISNDPADYEALTPGHFLIQRPLTAIPEPNLDSIPENRLSAWQRVQHYTQQLWKKWSQMYLSNLQNRTRWTRQRDNIGVGTMVVLKEENLPPLKWQLGRITEIHTGSDGNTRVVTVRTKDGSYRRAISKVCILPIRDNIQIL